MDRFFETDPVARPRISFVPPRRLGRGSYGCADIGMSDVIGPGDRRRERRAWDGFAAGRLGPPPTGRVDMTMTFAYYWRGTTKPEEILSHQISFGFEGWISDGVSPDRLSPPEVVDAAVADPSFAAHLESVTLDSGVDEVLWFDAGADAWWVGTLTWSDAGTGSTLHYVVVDPLSGAIRETIDRPWNEVSDGFP